MRAGDRITQVLCESTLENRQYIFRSYSGINLRAVEMRRWISAWYRRGSGCPDLVLLLACLTVLAACGGSASPASSSMQTASKADVGLTVQAQGWEATLLDLPQKTKQVGSGTGTAGEWGDVGVREAEGIWLIAPVRLTNTADEMQMLPGNLLKVRDGKGREFPTAARPVHATHVWNDDRWKSQENQLPQNPQEAGQAREGPLIFDIPEDATELRLFMEGEEGSISLGF
jgi:hypothetical protein